MLERKKTRRTLTALNLPTATATKSRPRTWPPAPPLKPFLEKARTPSRTADGNVVSA